MKNLPKLFFITLLVSVIFFSVSTAVQAASDVDSFVTREGTNFYLNGHEFDFVGHNIFDAAGAGDAPYSCVKHNGWFPRNYTDAELVASFEEAKAAKTTVVRFWAFQKYTLTSTGQKDWRGIDRVIELARQYGMKLLPVLEDGPGYCTEPGGGGNNKISKWQYQNDTWYVDGYKQKFAPYTLTYPEFVREIVTRYKDEPTIMAWMMVNEADTSKKNEQGKSVLVDFAKDIGQMIKSIDQNHLVTVGTQSNGTSGASGQDFLDVYGLDFIDFAEVHDWRHTFGKDKIATEAIVGAVENPDGTVTLPDPLSPSCLLQWGAVWGCALAQSNQILNKPLVIGESGYFGDNPTTRQTRANIFDKRIRVFFEQGGAGFLYWQFNNRLDTYESFDLVLGTNDPLHQTMAKYAGYQLDSEDPVEKQTPTPTKHPSVTLSPTITPYPQCTRADMNGDGQVNLIDYSKLVSNFLKVPLVNPEADINQDGRVDLVDYSLLVKSFLQPCRMGPTATITKTPSPTKTPSNTPTPSNTATPTFTPLPAQGKFQVLESLTLDKATVARGQTITGRVKYKNTGTTAVTIKDIVIGGRPPGGTNQGGPWLDFRPAQGQITLQPGQEIEFFANRTILSSDPTGQWYAFSTYSDNNGTYHDDPLKVYFTVTQ